MKIARIINRPEEDLQRACVQWLEIQERMGRLSFFSVPNGGKRGKREAWRLKQTGVRAGVPDLVILIPGGKTLFLELKSKIGRPSEAQKGFHAILVRCGFEVFIIKDIQEMIKVIQERQQKGLIP